MLLTRWPSAPLLLLLHIIVRRVCAVFALLAEHRVRALERRIRRVCGGKTCDGGRSALAVLCKYSQDF